MREEEKRGKKKREKEREKKLYENMFNFLKACMNPDFCKLQKFIFCGDSLVV